VTRPATRTARDRPLVIHLATTDMSLDWLLGPQLRAFQAAGYDVVGMSAPGPHLPALAADGIRHIAVNNLTRSPGTAGDVRAFCEIVRLLRRERPDVLHTHNPKPGVLGRIAGRLARVPVIINTQHGLYAQPTDRLRRRVAVYTVERIAAACSHQELVQNAEDARTLVDTLKVPSRRVTVLGNGIDLARFDGQRGQRDRVRAEWGISGQEVVAGVVGRLVLEKGLHELFAAARAVRVHGTGVRMVVVGPNDPDKPDGVSAEMVAQATADGINFVGSRSDMPECYSGMDVFVTASHREGFPRAAMEASASGLPVIATDIRGCRQVVDHDVTGLLVPVRDASALAAAISTLAADPALRARMGAAAAAKAATDFDQQHVIDITLQTYARLLAQRS